MPQTVDMKARTAAGYDLARQVIDLMEAHQVWATPLNFELWQQVAADPDGPLAQEVQALVATGEPVSDLFCEELAGRHLPRLKIADDVQDTGAALTAQLASVSDSVDAAKAITSAYARTLAGAHSELTSDMDVAKLNGLVEHLATETFRAHEQSSGLENRLTESTQEVRRLRDQLDQVRREAMLDGLTQLANRKAFDEAILEACRDADRSGRAVSLALVDIDHFKRVNDTWGHQTGDQVIRYVASTLGSVGEPRLVARYGGEEFAILFPRQTGAEAERTLERVRGELSARILRRRHTQEEIGKVTASAGLAQRRPGETPSTWIERADAALYVSKRTGRDRTTNADRVEALAA